MKVPVALALAATLLGGCTSYMYMSNLTGPKTDLTASLSGANEVPPSASPGQGYMTAVYRPTTKVVEWYLHFSQLSGPVTWAYLQGPDGVGNDDAAIVPINGPFEGSASRGGATLTDQQAADLVAGRWSVSIRTEQFPNGEIRGPLVPVKK